MRFSLVAKVSSDDPAAVEPVLRRLVRSGSVTREGDSFLVKAEVEGASAKELNRSMLSEIRRAEKRSRLRAEWTSEDGTTQRYFDYVLKGTKARTVTPSS